MNAKSLKVSKWTASILLVVVLCYGWLSFGIFSDREFSTLYLFSKHRLSPRFYFHAPIGESDKLLSALTPSQQRAELAFEEFVERNGGYFRRHRLFQ